MKHLRIDKKHSQAGERPCTVQQRTQGAEAAELSYDLCNVICAGPTSAVDDALLRKVLPSIHVCDINLRETMQKAEY